MIRNQTILKKKNNNQIIKASQLDKLNVRKIKR